MPESLVFRASQGGSTKKMSGTFTGDVYLNPFHVDSKAAIADVTFTPCARTYWHTHEKGQMLKVLNGSGWICDKGGVLKRLEAGDVVWAPAGTTHWHGADDNSLMTHLVIGLGKCTGTRSLPRRNTRRRVSWEAELHRIRLRERKGKEGTGEGVTKW